MRQIDLSIIILCYKSKEYLEALLPSIFRSEGVNFIVSPFAGNQEAGKYLRAETSSFVKASEGSIAEIIIVDNASDDGTLEWLRNYQRRDLRGRVNRAKEQNFILIKSAKNLGFSKGNNLGINRAKGKYILLLNPDTELLSDTLKVMLEFMESRPDVGISGCKLIKPNGKLDAACRRRFPNPWNSFKRLFLRDNSNYNYTGISEDKAMEVDSVVGAFLLIRRTLADKIGSLDESFFMYGEDLDWCWRCKEAGYKVWYYPKASIIHYKGESSKKIAFKALFWFHRAMWIFYEKHYKQKYPFILNWLIWLGIYFRLVLLAIFNFFKKEKRVSR